MFNIENELDTAKESTKRAKETLIKGMENTQRFIERDLEVL
jgi:hypothetical protein